MPGRKNYHIKLILWMIVVVLQATVLTGTEANNCLRGTMPADAGESNSFRATAPADAGTSYCFRVYLKDKGLAANAVEIPEVFLSAESIARRNKRYIEVTESDVPIGQQYIDAIVSAGFQLVTQSKWMSTLVVECADSLLVEHLNGLPMVDSVACVWTGTNRINADVCTDDKTPLAPVLEKLTDEYGYSRQQIEMLNGIKLHDLGRRGQGMRVAVIDAGFRHVDRIKAFASLQLLGTQNIVFPGADVFCGSDHGTEVLSCLASNLPGWMIGTAPEASYLLIKSEDMRTEFPIEEDFWAAAIEYADSVGVDVVTTSVGYYSFDNPQADYSLTDLDGKTAFISRVASIAAEKGILIFCCAGNEGNLPWGKIAFPADVADVVTVGAVTQDLERCAFSSTGFTADLRVKPDVVALGQSVAVISAQGYVRRVNGTSYSTPIVAGLGICLWQSLHWLSNVEVIELIRQTSSQADRPDVEKGFGVPDFFKAYRKGLE
ncbi:MAG: S8 family serine peptidase [Tannerella sp.]|nr:S8 family serine peptidase [Tannerella sp.]